MKIGVFYTENSPYEQVLRDYLYSSLIRNDLLERIELQIMHTQNYGYWIRNVAEKPLVIRHMLSQLQQDEGLVFLDADATIEQYPILFDEISQEYDIAFYTLNWNDWYGYNQSPSIKEILSGTMFFRNRDKVKALCEEWHKLAIESNEWEQKILQKILDKYDLKVYNLPIEYCYIKTLPSGKEPKIKIEKPIIIHHQISRLLKGGRI
jgi:hypothetical protein